MQMYLMGGLVEGRVLSVTVSDSSARSRRSGAKRAASAASAVTPDPRHRSVGEWPRSSDRGHYRVRMSDETLRRLDLTQIGAGRYKAVNARGGVLPIGEGGRPRLHPGGAAARGARRLYGDRRRPDHRQAGAARDVRRPRRGPQGARRGRDPPGRPVGRLDVPFPEGEAGDAARACCPSAIQQAARPALHGRPHRRAADVQSRWRASGGYDSRDAGDRHRLLRVPVALAEGVVGAAFGRDLLDDLDAGGVDVAEHGVRRAGAELP